MDLDALAVGLLLAASFAAGFVDAVAGGGGLITTPALMILAPGAPIATVLATTKCASFAGTAAAAGSYSGRIAPPWRILVPAMAAALPASWLGARMVSALDPALVRPAILAVLIAMALYTWLRPRLGAAATQGIAPQAQPWAAAATGGIIGFYDGLLGPGTGTLLVIAFIAVFGRDFLRASAAAKFINGTSNLGALAWFAAAGHVWWSIALPMAACNLLGGVIGSRMAMLAGNVWIRRVFLAVVVALIARLGWNLFG